MGETKRLIGYLNPSGFLPAKVVAVLEEGEGSDVVFFVQYPSGLPFRLRTSREQLDSEKKFVRVTNPERTFDEEVHQLFAFDESTLWIDSRAGIRSRIRRVLGSTATVLTAVQRERLSKWLVHGGA